ncbi:MAG: antitoxin, partial [Alphaproteobacteria bacterium]|nr:antitoxin [Alphaproteobacteria bacterium]
GQGSGSQVQNEAEPTELADSVLAPKQKYALADLIARCDSKAATPEGLALWECAKLAGQELG